MCYDSPPPMGSKPTTNFQAILRRMFADIDTLHTLEQARIETLGQPEQATPVAGSAAATLLPRWPTPDWVDDWARDESSTVRAYPNVTETILQNLLHHRQALAQMVQAQQRQRIRAEERAQRLAKELDSYQTLELNLCPEEGGGTFEDYIPALQQRCLLAEEQVKAMTLLGADACEALNLAREAAYEGERLLKLNPELAHRDSFQRLAASLLELRADDSKAEAKRNAEAEAGHP